jgi:hypothetical protein
MQPADRLGPQRDQVALTVGQETQHPTVVDRFDDMEPTVTQRHDRRRTGVVTIGLGVAAGIQQASPRRQPGWHIKDGFARCDERLCQQRGSSMLTRQ